MNGSPTKRTARWFHLAVLLSAAPFAGAANFTVAPVRMELGSDQRAVALTLTNSDAKPVVVEARVYLWEQVGGEDKLTPSNDLIVTPALADVPGKAAQLIRVGRRSQVRAGATERTYRVVLQEVVPSAEAAPNGVTFALRMSLPVFIAPRLGEKELARPKPEWSAQLGPKGELKVTLRNAGNKRIQLIGLEAHGADGKPRGSFEQMTYVLAGQSHTYTLKASGPPPAPGTLLTLKANTDAGDQVASVALTKP